MDHRFMETCRIHIGEQQELRRLVSNCLYCERIDDAANRNTPVLCTKFSGSGQPIRVNFNTCLTCGEYQ